MRLQQIPHRQRLCGSTYNTIAMDRKDKHSAALLFAGEFYGPAWHSATAVFPSRLDRITERRGQIMYDKKRHALNNVTVSEENSATAVTTPRRAAAARTVSQQFSFIFARYWLLDCRQQISEKKRLPERIGEQSFFLCVDGLNGATCGLLMRFNRKPGSIKCICNHVRVRNEW